MSDLTSRSSSEELANPDNVSRDHVIRRLQDWKDRVHALYEEIEQGLSGSAFHVNREGKHTALEELPQRVGLSETDQPKIDIMRIIRPDGTNAAILNPRGLWIIGANGRVDLRIVSPVGGSEMYLLLDQSAPLAGRANWIRSPIGSPFEREPFSPHWLLSKLH